MLLQNLQFIRCIGHQLYYNQFKLIQCFKLNQIKAFSTKNNPKSFEDLKRIVIQNIEGDLSNRFKTDILIYENDRPKFYQKVFLYNVVQYIFWCYGALIAYSFYFQRRKPEKPEEKVDLTDTEFLMKSLEPVKSSFWESVKEKKSQIAVAASFLIFGHLTAIALAMFCMRSVRFIVMKKGGQRVKINCYSPFGTDNKRHTHDIPLDHLSCQIHRSSATAYMPLKIKGRRLFFLIDSRGKFYHPTLFDQTVGVFRLLK